MQTKILHLPTWQKTDLGTPLELYQKDHSHESGRLLFIGGMHGDEPEGVRLAQELLAWLTQMHDSQVQLKYSWVLLPDINPDGSKNKTRTNGRGVDLNRNFPTPDWTQEHTQSRYYPGSFPSSEAEVKALCQLMNEENFNAIIHFHSWKPCVIWSGTDGKQYAETLTLNTGYEARQDIGYPTPGSLGQYGSLVLSKPVICIEAQEHSDLSTVWPRFKDGLTELMTKGCRK